MRNGNLSTPRHSRIPLFAICLPLFLGAAAGCDPDPEPSETSSTEGSASSSEASESTGVATLTGDGSCEPARPENECSICLAEICCPELLDCAADADCACLLACLSAGGELDACIFEECPGVQNMPLASNLNGCASVECSGICPQGAWQP